MNKQVGFDIMVFNPGRLFNLLALNMHSGLSQLEEASKFKKQLQEYWASKGITQIKIPQIGGKELNLFKLYKSVCKKGGGEAVSHNKMWKEIVDEFGLPSTCTSASFTLKNHYQKYLLGYEQKHYFGKDDGADLPQLVAGRTRKPITGMRGGEDGGYTINYMTKYGDKMMDSNSLATELNKYYQKMDKNTIVNFIKRTKMYPSMPEVKRLILGFQSRLPNEINFSLNTLLLYSVNTEAPFLFMQYPSVIESIYSFIRNLLPITDLKKLQLLRTITLIIRNLAIDYRNLQAIQESNMAELFLQIFESRIDREVNRNLVDIFSSLTNIGWNYTKLFDHIEEYIEKDSIEDLETGIDLLKTLVEEKQQICEELIINKMDFFVRLLLHQEFFIREAILEIFAYLTDKSDPAKEACLNSFRFMNRIFAILSHSTGNSEKQAQLAGYILNNLSRTYENLQILRKFERNIAIISFNDDSLSSITTSILFKLSQPREEMMEENGDDMQEE